MHFSKNSRKVTSTFLNLVKLEACTTDAIVDVDVDAIVDVIAYAMKQKLSSRKLDLARPMAIGTDNVIL